MDPMVVCVPLINKKSHFFYDSVPPSGIGRLECMQVPELFPWLFQRFDNKKLTLGSLLMIYQGSSWYLAQVGMRDCAVRTAK